MSERGNPRFITAAEVFTIAQLTLTDEQIKTQDTIYEIAPDPGDGKIIIPASIAILTNFTVAYTGADATASFVIDVAGSNFFTIQNDIWGLYSGSPQMFATNYPATFSNDNFGSLVPGVFAGGVSQFQGALRAHLNNASAGDLSGGDPANTLKITAYYYLLTP